MHRRTRRAARRAGGGLHVERIEVVVLADAVFGGRAVEPRQRAGQDRQLLAGVIADDADLGADARAFRIQRQRHGLHVAQPGRVVAIDAEIVHRVAIDGVQFDFLAVLEHRGRHHRSGRHDVPVGQDQAAHGVDHEARRLARLVPLRVEGAGLVDFDGDDRRRDALDRAVPGGAFGGGLRHRRNPRPATATAATGRAAGPRRRGRPSTRRSQFAAVRRAEALLEFVHVEAVVLRAGVRDLDGTHQ